MSANSWTSEQQMAQIKKEIEIEDELLGYYEDNELQAANSLIEIGNSNINLKKQYEWNEGEFENCEPSFKWATTKLAIIMSEATGEQKEDCQSSISNVTHRGDCTQSCSDDSEHDSSNSVSGDDLNLVPISKSYKCITCNGSFSHEHCLKKNILSVSKKLKQFQCSQCNYTISQKRNSSKHFNITHTKLKPFQIRILARFKSIDGKYLPIKCSKCLGSCSDNVDISRGSKSTKKNLKLCKCFDRASFVQPQYPLDSHSYAKQYSPTNLYNGQNNFKEGETTLKNIQTNSDVHQYEQDNHFVQAEENQLSATDCLSEDDCVSPSDSVDCELQEVSDLIEFDLRLSRGHYASKDDAIAVKPFDPNLKRSSRVSFKTVASICPDDEIFIYIQYRNDILTAPTIHKLVEDNDTSIAIPQLDNDVSLNKCKCFHFHPLSAFCVCSTKAEVTWCLMSGVPVAKLHVEKETKVDIEIGFWSTKLLKRHTFSSSGSLLLFTQLVFHVKKSNTIYEQRLFYKTCLSVTRDIQLLVEQIKKNFPESLKLPYSESVLSARSARLKDRDKRGKKSKEKETKLIYPSPLRISLNRKFWPQLEKLLESTDSVYKIYELSS